MSNQTKDLLNCVLENAIDLADEIHQETGNSKAYAVWYMLKDICDKVNSEI